MSDGFRVMAKASTTPPRDPAELRARAVALLRARIAELWANLRANPQPPAALPSETRER